MLGWLRSLLYAAVFYGGTPGFVLAALAAGSNERRLRTVVRGWCRFHRACAAHIVGVRSRVVGALPPGPLLIAVRHESFFETLEAPLIFDMPAIMAKRELTDLPLWGEVAQRYGIIGIDRDAGARALRAMLKAARAQKAQGRSILLFPEGTRIPAGVEAPLQPGLAGLYATLGLPLVPVAVSSGRAFRRVRKVPGVVTWRIDSPIPPGLPREEMERRVLAAFHDGGAA